MAIGLGKVWGLLTRPAHDPVQAPASPSTGAADAPRARRRPIVLIACAASKVDTHGTRIPAAELYSASTLFSKSLAYARAITSEDHIRILSAKHGAIPPDERIATYDVPMHSLGAAAQHAWAERVRSELVNDFGPAPAAVIILAGKEYTDELQRHLRSQERPDRLPWAVTMPFGERQGERMSQGERLHWLNERLVELGVPGHPAHEHRHAPAPRPAAGALSAGAMAMLVTRPPTPAPAPRAVGGLSAGTLAMLGTSAAHAPTAPTLTGAPRPVGGLSAGTFARLAATTAPVRATPAPTEVPHAARGLSAGTLATLAATAAPAPGPRAGGLRAETLAMLGSAPAARPEADTSLEAIGPQSGLLPARPATDAPAPPSERAESVPVIGKASICDLRAPAMARCRRPRPVRGHHRQPDPRPR